MPHTHIVTWGDLDCPSSPSLCFHTYKTTAKLFLFCPCLQESIHTCRINSPMMSGRLCWGHWFLEQHGSPRGF